MTPFLYDNSAAYRMEELHGQATSRRMATAAKASAMHRSAHPFRDALGNGLIALGSKLTDPPAVEDFDLDRAA
jgi:hypothetical protein